MRKPREGNAPERPLTSVMEDYLEAISELDQEKKVVRVKDIAKRMDVKMPTVSSMLRTLSDRGMVSYEKYEYVELTPDGETVGREMSRRHRILFDFLTRVLRVDQETADIDACRMEHALSPGTLESLTGFMEFIQNCPRAGEGWLDHFEEFLHRGGTPDGCNAGSCIFPCGDGESARSLTDPRDGERLP
jgi:DtxR family Mn-dependent transcriptional regulator